MNRAIAGGRRARERQSPCSTKRRCHRYVRQVGARDHVEIKAVAFSALIQKRPLAWQPPMRELMQKPDAADFVWRRLQYVFGFDDPRTFPRVDLDWGDDEERLRRFVDHGRTLARTSLLGSGDNVRITEAAS